MGLRSLVDRVSLLAARHHAGRTLARFLDRARHASRTQEQVLREKLARNAESEFGRRHRFADIRDYADFAARVPLSTYEEYAPFIERLKEGEFGALFGGGQRVLMFALTSGTTREPKYIPVTPPFLTEYRRGWNAWGLRALTDHPGCLLRGILQVSSPMDEHRTAAGIPCGAITGLMAATQKRLVRRYYVVPPAAAKIRDAAARYYTIMRFAVPRDVAFVITANPATLLLLAETADARSEALIRDVRDGTLDEGIDVPGFVRDALRGRLRPEPSAAARLDGLRRARGRLRPRDYWRLGFVAHWTGGTMGLYRSRFPMWFGEVPVRDPGLLASEGRISVPVDDDTPAGILDVSAHFYEFIPADEYESPRRRALLPRDLRTGKEYFIVLTTSSGLYRYDLGDRVRVTDWYGEAPVIEFLSKGAHTSSLAGEKLTEHQVVLALRAAGARLGRSLDGSVLAPRWGAPPYYRLYVASDATAGVRPAEDGPADAARIAEALDAELRAANVEYESKRSSGRLGAVEPQELAKETLTELDRRLRARQDGRAEQYKHRYLLTKPDEDDAWFAQQA